VIFQRDFSIPIIGSPAAALAPFLSIERSRHEADIGATPRTYAAVFMMLESTLAHGGIAIRQRQSRCLTGKEALPGTTMRARACSAARNNRYSVIRIHFASRFDRFARALRLEQIRDRPTRL
jgi:hypothetical protein